MTRLYIETIDIYVYIYKKYIYSLYMYKARGLVERILLPISFLSTTPSTHHLFIAPSLYNVVFLLRFCPTPSFYIYQNIYIHIIDIYIIYIYTQSNPSTQTHKYSNTQPTDQYQILLSRLSFYSFSWLKPTTI